MSDWILELSGQYERDYARYEKKQSSELSAVLNNLDTYFNALKKCGHPFQVKAGYIHDEPEGIKAIDQKGGKQKVKLEQTRLYVYPDTRANTLHLLAIGNKSTQRDDIKLCRKLVGSIKGGGSNV